MRIAKFVKETTTSPVQFTVYLDVDNDGVFSEDEKGVDAVPAFAEQVFPNSFPILFEHPDRLQTLLRDKLARINVKVVVEDMDDIVVETDELVASRVEEDVEDILTFEPGFIGSVHRAKIHEAVGLGSMRSPAISSQDPNVNIFNQDVPDLNARRGKKNECVPISAANSLLWLAAKHNFTNQLPSRADDLIDEIEKDVKWTEQGTKPENFLPGQGKADQ